MEGEAGVLQQRVQVVAVQRRREDALEGIGGEEGKGQEADRDHGLDRQHPRLEPRGQVAAEGRHRAAEQRQDQDPQQHGALVVPPDAGDLVEQRLGRVGVLDHVDQREVGDDVGLGQRPEGDRHAEQLHQRGRPRKRHQPGMALLGAVERQHGLNHRHQQRQNQCEVSQFRDHCP